MSDFLTVVKDNALAITTLVGVFTIIGTGLGFWLNFRLSRKKLESDKKALRQQMITNNIAPMRQQWINDVRVKSAELLSDLHFILVCKTLKNKDNDRSEKLIKKGLDLLPTIQYKLTYLEILLPSSDDESLSNELSGIRHCLNILMSLSYLPDEDVDKKYAFDTISTAIICIRNILKKEWEVTKSLKEIE
ncbi:hypothetical protein [Morganella morganii]|uniref:hypothetical protein n=1 Tax=Morganella morganii TaxID=582 RepID=UPI0034D58AEE